MSIKTVVVEYLPKAKKMAREIEEKANEMEQKGYEFITFSITGSSKAILVFRDKIEQKHLEQEQIEQVQQEEEQVESEEADQL